MSTASSWSPATTATPSWPGCTSRASRSSPAADRSARPPRSAMSPPTTVTAPATDTLARAGRRVPEDIAVGGFDDSPAALSSRPSLTTIRQPWDRISTEMVRMLLARIAGEEPAVVILPTELVRRESA
nr:substrate-binding domain-containing protein [Streptomyces sp. ISL-94]